MGRLDTGRSGSFSRRSDSRRVPRQRDIVNQSRAIEAIPTTAASLCQNRGRSITFLDSRTGLFASAPYSIPVPIHLIPASRG